MCDGINHNLIAIYSDHAIGHEEVVRWCEDCGAVVVDLDVNGVTQSGGIKKMMFPSGKLEK